MKKAITISILGNLLLLGVIAVTLQKGAPSAGGRPGASVAESNRVSGPAISRTTNTIVLTNAGPRFTWRDVESADYKVYIDKLRGIGCPEETIRDIIIADLNKSYGKKIAGLRGDQNREFKFWKSGNDWAFESAEYAGQYRQMEKEKRELIRELLGIDYQKEMARLNGYNDPSSDPVMAAIPLEKRDQIQEISEKYQMMQQEVYRKTKGFQDEDTQAELKDIEKQRRTELKKILSPQELEEIDLRTSQLAQNLKWELQGFDPSESEFRAIYRARQAADDPQPGQAGKELDDQLKGTLGDRYKEYKLNQDWEYKNLVLLAERQGLGKETAGKIYDMKQEVEQAVRNVRGDRELNPEQRAEKLRAVRAETEKAVAEALGEKGYKNYKRNAWWIRNISPNQ